MANPLSSAQQTLSTNLVAETWWTYDEDTPVLVQHVADFGPDIWHKGVIVSGGDVVDLVSLVQHEVSYYDDIQVDFTSPALAGALMDRLKNEPTSVTIIRTGWTPANDWDLRLNGGTNQTGDTLFAEGLAQLLIDEV